MRIAHVRIRNILGIGELEFDAGRFVEISGHNGANKTNVLNAVKSVFEGGHDATLLQAGAERGEVVLVLDDGLELRKTVKADGSTTSVKKPGVKQPLSRPMDVVRSLADVFSVNPISFLTAPKQDRAKVMLESMPLEIDEARLANIVGFNLPPWQPGLHATAKIDAVRKLVYDSRTDTNRELEQKRKTVSQLEQAMPAAPGGADYGSEAELELSLMKLQKEREAELDTLAGKVDKWMRDKDARVDEMKREHENEVATIRAQIQALHELIVEITSQHTALMSEAQQSTDNAKSRAISRRAEIHAKYDQLESSIKEPLAAIRADRGAAAKREQTQAIIRELSEAASILDAQSNDKTATLHAIDAYKQELLASLPIPGIEIVGGEIFRKGVPFERLNMAQRVGIAVELAKLRAGKLGIVCLDGLELMDSESYAEFQRQAEASGLQFFVTRVADGDFRINTTEEAPF